MHHFTFFYMHVIYNTIIQEVRRRYCLYRHHYAREESSIICGKTISISNYFSPPFYPQTGREESPHYSQRNRWFDEVNRKKNVKPTDAVPTPHAAPHRTMQAEEVSEQGGK